MDSIAVGVENNFVCSANNLMVLKEKHKSLDFFAIPLFHPRLRRDKNGISSFRDDRIGLISRCDMVLSSNEWVSFVVGMISSWIDLDSKNENIRLSSQAALYQEIAWGTHLGLQAVILPTPHYLKSPNYSRIINQLSNVWSGNHQQVWLRIPLVLPLTNNLSETANEDGWILWDSFRHFSSHNSLIGIAIEINGEDSLKNINENVLNRWAAEPIKALIISTSLFGLNKAGYPALSQLGYDIIGSFLRFKVQVILTGRPHLSTQLPGDDGNQSGESTYQPYIDFIRHLKSAITKPKVISLGEQYTASYRDALQTPLQPLMDNLESQTYEIFEKDPVKYERYEHAITLALVQLSNSHNFNNNDNQSNDSEGIGEPTAILTVFGAGRGPLVAAALSAASQANVSVRIYAVEKNPNAIITLRNRAKSERWNNVTIIASDMRECSPPELCDIMISELLGSFGDNELSPECLDGAQKWLKPHGISIPSSYTSYIAPLSSSKLWMNARDATLGKIPGLGLETPFVVKLHNIFQIDEPKPLFQFDHPNYDAPRPDNTRYKSVTFTASVDVTIHGFAGYFEATLFDDTIISINPKTATKDMFSWFPYFIPLQSPTRVNAGPVSCSVQNSNGHAYFIGL
eukprot:gene10849-14564_t